MRKTGIKDFAEYRGISSLKFSPDKKKAAFVVIDSDLKNNKYNANIWLYDTESEHVRQITSNDDTRSYKWINNEELIFAAVRKEEYKKRLASGEKFTVYYKINVNGGEAVEYFKVPLTVGSIGLLDDDKFAVMSKQITLPENPRQYSGNPADFEVFDELPFWFDGGGIVNKKRNRLYVYDKKTESVECITDKYTTVVSFKSKGSTIVYIGNRFTDKQEQFNGLYQYDINTKETKTLLEPTHFDIKYVDFYKDSVVFSAMDLRIRGINGDSDFFTFENGELKTLYYMPYNMFSTVNSDARQGSNDPIIIKDDEVYFCPTECTNSHLKKIDKNGELVDVILENGSIDGFDLSDDRILYIAMKGDKLQEIYEHTANGDRQITHINENGLKDKMISTPEYVEVENAGINIQGFIMKPVDFDPSKKYPGVLLIHGGPKSIYGCVHNHEMQLLASEGYFVFFCNPHGSDGRGREFADIRGKYGTVDFEDLMKFTDACLAKYPQMDPERLGVSGGSYGGFMTNWIIGHTDRFKCAISQRGIANWISKFLTTDKGYNYNADQQASTPWSDTEKIWWHSPLKYADKVKTPTLFIQADQDYRCWMSEALQMFSALKYHGIESRVCLFHGESHGLNTSGKPMHKLRRLEETLYWLDDHLK